MMAKRRERVCAPATAATPGGRQEVPQAILSEATTVSVLAYFKIQIQLKDTK